MIGFRFHASSVSDLGIIRLTIPDSRFKHLVAPAIAVLLSAAATAFPVSTPKPGPARTAKDPAPVASVGALRPSPATASSRAADWPMFRGNDLHSGFVPVKVNLPLKPLWTWHGTATSIVSSPAVVGDSVYVGTRDDPTGFGKSGSLIALDRATGKLKWRYNKASAARTIKIRSTAGRAPLDASADPLDLAGVDSSPAVSGDVVYFTSRDGALHAVTTSGALKWRLITGGGDKSSPVVEAGTVYIGSGFPNKDFWAVDADGGVVKWRANSGLADPLLHRGGQYVYSSPAFADGVVYAAAGDGGFYAIDAAKGKVKWRYETRGGVYMHSPTVAGDIIIAAPGDFDTAVYGIDRKTGELVWKYDSGYDHSYVSSPAFDGESVYVCMGDPAQQIVALDARTGKLKWKQPLGVAPGATFCSSPAVTDNAVFVGTAQLKRGDPESGRLIALDRSTGALLWQAALPKPVVSSPAVAGDVVVVGCTDGSVVAFKWAT